MRTSTRFARQFNVHLDRGSLAVTEPSFTSGYLSEVGAAISDDQIIATALGSLSRRIANGPALLNPRVTREYLVMRLAGLEHEVFTCLILDNRHRVIACESCFAARLTEQTYIHGKFEARTTKIVFLMMILFYSRPATG